MRIIFTLGHKERELSKKNTETLNCALLELGVEANTERTQLDVEAHTKD